MINRKKCKLKWMFNKESKIYAINNTNCYNNAKYNKKVRNTITNYFRWF